MAKVIRQGKGGGVSSIRAKELVPGDIVEVSGNKKYFFHLFSYFLKGNFYFTTEAKLLFFVAHKAWLGI